MRRRLVVNLSHTRRPFTAFAPGPKDIRDFIGSLQIKNAHRGVFITTSSFTAEARDAATKGGKQIVLIDGHRLTDLMIERDVGVEVQQTYVVKSLNSDFFDAG